MVFLFFKIGQFLWEISPVFTVDLDIAKIVYTQSSTSAALRLTWRSGIVSRQWVWLCRSNAWDTCPTRIWRRLCDSPRSRDALRRRWTWRWPSSSSPDKHHRCRDTAQSMESRCAGRSWPPKSIGLNENDRHNVRLYDRTWHLTSEPYYAPKNE